jgi:HAMP domain-containing protein
MREAYDLGVVSGQKNYSEHVGGRNPGGDLDIRDYIHIDLTSPGDLHFRLTGPQSGSFTANVALYFIWDRNNNLLLDEGELLDYTRQPVSTPTTISKSGLQAGSYYAMIGAYDAYVTNQVRYTDYTLTVTTDAAGETLGTARNLGVLDEDSSYSDYVGTIDPNDLYRFQLTGTRSLQINLTGLTSNADLYLVQDVNRNGSIDNLEILKSSVLLGNASETINLPGLVSGDYYIWVRQSTPTSNTNYTLNLSAKTIDVGETYSTATEVGILSGQKVVNGSTNISNDPGDVYRFSLATMSNIRLDLSGLTGNTDLYLVRDRNGNNVVDSDDVLDSSVQLGLTPETINFSNLAAGTYFAYVTPGTGSSGTVNYTLKLTADGAGSTYSTARNIGVLGTTPSSFVDFVGDWDTTDVYRFQVTATSNVTINLGEFTANANLYLTRDLNANGQFDAGETLRSSTNSGILPESIQMRLAPGTYYVYVQSSNSNTDYKLSVSSTPLATQTIQGTLGVDVLTPNLNYDRTIISGNGNVDFGTGRYDTLDLSWIPFNSVQLNLANANGGGVAYNPGNGSRLFDQIILANGQEILFEGIDRIQFSNQPIFLSTLPNDTLFNQQWNLHMTGVHNAWRFTTGTDKVLIGVQDSGLALNAQGNRHNDLSRRFWYWTENDYDDDFFRNIPDDDYGPKQTSHGTAVQSIIGANSNNGQGMSGINWISEVYVTDVIDGNTGDWSKEEATRRMAADAVSKGKRLVINMSFSGGGAVPALEQLIAQYQDQVLFVVSAGNDDTPTLNYPAQLAQRYGNVIAVGASWGRNNRFGQATNPGDRISYSNWGSNYGNGLTLMAPSEVIAAKAAKDGNNIRFDFFDYKNDISGSSDRSDNFDGTSAAAPHVAGIASLVWSANPTLTATQLKQILSETAIDLGTPGYDIYTGHGLVNADAAVRRALALA